ncbi:protein ENHANCED DISEASE RESISTANCE 2-like [Oryza glaberrima]|uniref:START domain-containing protein n=1 Tax=Oryza glaberrima TaxID=4538 RepID=I1QIZ6_ORYGL|nr:protein ENHANCED DISEASE RESISTANCE 2-like [Oryza glaberrima]
MATITLKPPATAAAAGGEVSEVELSEAGSPDVGSQSSGSGGSGRSTAGSSGWVYHLGVNSIGHEYRHLRFLVIRGKTVAMYKRDPSKNPGIQPIRKGVVSHTLMVEELGRRITSHGELYVLRFYNRLDQTKKGEIACGDPGEARKWVEAFEQAKQQADYDLMTRGVSWNRSQNENELNLDGHRPRVRRYAQGLGKLVRIGKGPEKLLRQSSNLQSHEIINTNFGGDSGDAFEAHEWRYVRTFNGIRIFEDIANTKGGKGVLLKSVGVVGANPDTVFAVVLSSDKHKRYEWDMLTADLELVETIDGYYDVVYGTYEPRYLSWWKTKKDFVFSRQWFRGQDGAYTILQIPASHKNKPPRHGYKRTKINSSTWELRRLNPPGSSTPKCLVTHMLEMSPSFWDRWKRRHNENFDRSIAFALLSQVAGLREYFAANPALTSDLPSTVVKPKQSDSLIIQSELEDSELNDEFYDALARGESFEDEDSDDDDDMIPKAGKVKFKNISWAIAGLAMKPTKASVEKSELVTNSTPVTIDSNHFHGTLRRAKSENDPNSWSEPGGEKFMIRGKTYLIDYTKVVGGDPLLKLIAVDWFKADERFDSVALHPKSLVQSEAAKKIPFILVINLQVPAKPNYNLVMYYAAERPVNKDSLLGRFIDGTDAFRDARFKLIPSIVEGYWMVKRAVGTKACLLGKAVTCNYLRQDNFLEIDVDIGSSSVARSIIGLVLGYVTGLVVDLAILIEAKEEKELPEYILGTVRLNRANPDSAVPI